MGVPPDALHFVDGVISPPELEPVQTLVVKAAAANTSSRFCKSFSVTY